MNPDRLREKNKVAFDTMIMIDLIESDENVKIIFEEWRDSLEKTEFFISSNVIKETYGVLINKKNFDPADAREKINEICEFIPYRNFYGTLFPQENTPEEAVVAHIIVQ